MARSLLIGIKNTAGDKLQGLEGRHLFFSLQFIELHVLHLLDIETSQSSIYLRSMVIYKILLYTMSQWTIH